MRLINFLLAALLLFIQYPLWIGQGGWLRVYQMQTQLHQAREKILDKQARNDLLEADVDNLKEGQEAVEERARLEMNMIKPDEIFVQVLKPGSQIPEAPESIAVQQKPAASN